MIVSPVSSSTWKCSKKVAGKSEADTVVPGGVNEEDVVFDRDLVERCGTDEVVCAVIPIEAVPDREAAF